MRKKLKMDPELAFEEVKDMLYKLAWTTHYTHGLPFETCKSECYFAFVKAYNWRYDPTKGTKFSTCVYGIAKWRMRNLIRERMSEIPMLEINEEVAGAAPPERSESLELIDDLSADAKEIIQLILETPAEILGHSPVPISHLLGRIKAYLEKRGRPRRALNEAHREIQQRFQEAWAV